jgi:hypothetical protein
MGVKIGPQELEVFLQIRKKPSYTWTAEGGLTMHHGLMVQELAEGREERLALPAVNTT